MSRAKSKQKSKHPTVFDTSFKTWVNQRPVDIVPLLLTDAVYEETLNVEIIRSTMRADKVFRIKYHGKDHILHLEFETGLDEDLRTRLAVYNIVLYRDHALPVITMVVYPFRVPLAQSPLHIESDGEPIILFYFKVMPLFDLDAEQYVQQHLVCMYPLLPTMRGANAALIKQAMDELAALYQHDVVTLAQQFIWLKLLLERADTIDRQEKNRIQEQLSMYDPLWENHPKVKQIRAESRAVGEKEGREKGLKEGREKGLVEGIARGKLEAEVNTLQRLLVNVVSARFPELAELAQEQVKRVDKPDALDLLIQKLAIAPDEQIARWLLCS